MNDNEYKPLKELNLHPGDKVEYLDFGLGKEEYVIGIHNGELCAMRDGNVGQVVSSSRMSSWRVISRGPEETCWRDMTRAEKGEILLAIEEGKTIEINCGAYGYLAWDRCPSNISDVHQPMRVRRDPEVYSTEIYYTTKYGRSTCLGHINIVDGRPDLDSALLVAQGAPD